MCIFSAAFLTFLKQNSVVNLHIVLTLLIYLSVHFFTFPVTREQETDLSLEIQTAQKQHNCAVTYLMSTQLKKIYTYCHLLKNSKLTVIS